MIALQPRPRSPPPLGPGGLHDCGGGGIAVRSLSLETTYGVLCISTSFTWHDHWDAPTIVLTVGNDIDGYIRLHFSDPDALDNLATAVRRLQRDCRTYSKRLRDTARLHAAS
jgi:hypothetical protein